MRRNTFNLVFFDICIFSCLQKSLSSGSAKLFVFQGTRSVRFMLMFFLLTYLQWFQNHGDQGRVLSVRDLLSWVSFINCTAQGVGLSAAFVHGALLVLLDGLGLGTLFCRVFI